MMKKSAVLTLLLCCLFLPSSVLAGGVLKDIQFKPLTDEAEQVTFVLNGIYMPKSFILKGKKPRIVFDFPNVTREKGLPNRIDTKGKLVQRIRVGVHKEKVPTIRVVFDILPGKLVWYRQDFDRNTNRLTVTVQPTGADAQASGRKGAKPTAARKKIEYTATAPATDQARVKAKAVEKAEPAKQPSPAQPTSQQKQAKPAKVKAAGPRDPFAIPDMSDMPPASTTPAEPQPQAGATPQPEKTPSPAEKKKEAKKTEKAADTVKAAASGQGGKAKKKPVTTAAPVPAAEKPEDGALPAASGGKTPLLSSVEFDDSSNRGEMILFKLNDFYPPVVFGLEEGVPRVVCDFKNTRAAENIPNVIKANGRLLKTIRIGKYNNPRKVRVVLDLAPNNSYDLQQVFFKEDNLFVIIINTMDNALSEEDVKNLL